MLSFRTFLAEADEQRIDPKSFDLKALYRELNRSLFAGKLEDIPLVWGKKKGVAAAATCMVTRPRNLPVMYAKTIPGSVKITVNPAPYTLTTLKGILAHEMCHVETMLNNQHERDSHGAYFHNALRRAQQHASFTIPLKHTADEEEKASLTAKPVKFLAAEKSDGSTYLALYTPNLAPEHVAKITKDLDTHVRYGMRFKWIAFGDGSTVLANHLTVMRMHKHLKMWKVDKDLKDLNVSRVQAAAGAPPPGFTAAIRLGT